MKKIISFTILLLFLFSFPKNEKVFSYKNKDELTLTYNENVYKIKLNNVKTNSNIHTIIWQSSKFSRKSKNENKAKTILKFYNATGDIENSFEMCFPGIKKEIANLEKTFNTESSNAKLVYNTGFKIIKEKNGFTLNKEQLYFHLLDKLKTGKVLELEIPTKKFEARFKEADFKNSTNLRSSFSTDYSKSSLERKNNIQKAISSFNGLNIYPGESVSFNDITGQRNEKNGYKEAKIIVGGKYIEGFGGGVCQASTTIYNACIRAGLDCRAKCHSIPPSYVGKGLDAMVNTGSSDMIITNNLKYPVYIMAYCTNESVCCKVYGESLDGISYKTKVVVNETLPDKGYKKVIDTKKEFLDKVVYTDESFIKQVATQGFKTTTYLQTYKNDKLISEKKLRADFYPPSEGIIIFGSEERPPEEVFIFDEVVI